MKFQGLEAGDALDSLIEHRFFGSPSMCDGEIYAYDPAAPYTDYGCHTCEADFEVYPGNKEPHKWIADNYSVNQFAALKIKRKLIEDGYTVRTTESAGYSRFKVYHSENLVGDIECFNKQQEPLAWCKLALLALEKRASV
jgi:hypothetical protein